MTNPTPPTTAEGSAGADWRPAYEWWCADRDPMPEPIERKCANAFRAGWMSRGRASPTDEQVERAARAISEEEWGDSQPWNQKPRSFKDRYRRYARAALSTAPGEGEQIKGTSVECLLETPALLESARQAMCDPSNRFCHGLLHAIIGRLEGKEPEDYVAEKVESV